MASEIIFNAKLESSGIQSGMDEISNKMRQSSLIANPTRPSIASQDLARDSLQEESTYRIDLNNEKLVKQAEVLTTVTSSLSMFNDGLKKIIDNFFGIHLKQKTTREESFTNPNNFNNSDIEDRIIKGVVIGAVTKKALGGASNVINQVHGNRWLKASGDLYQARANNANTVSNVAGNIAQAGLASGNPIGMVIGGVSGLISLGTKAYANRQEDIQKGVDKYKEYLPMMDQLLANYAPMTASSGHTKSTLATGYIEALENKAKNTGLALDEFISNTNSLGAYGVSHVNDAGSLARQAALYASFTNGNASDFTEKIGKMARYGTGNAASDMEYAYGAARASGLQRGQFSEFLDGLERIIESGISKGYTQSTKEVADTMAFMSKLSGGSELWKGTNGANRITEFSQGLSSTTGLSSTNDILAYRAMQNIKNGETYLKNSNPLSYVDGATYSNYMAMAEKGLTVDSFKAIKDIINTTYTSTDDKIEAWKQIAGTNNTGANMLYNMSLLKDVTADDIKKFEQNPEFMSDNKLLRNSLNSLDTTLLRIGNTHFPKALNSMERNRKILESILRATQDRTVKNLAETAFNKDKFDFSERKDRKANQKEIKDLFDKTTDYDERVLGMEALDEMSSWSYMDGWDLVFNDLNLQKDLDFTSMENFKKSVYEIEKKFTPKNIEKAKRKKLSTGQTKVQNASSYADAKEIFSKNVAELGYEDIGGIMVNDWGDGTGDNAEGKVRQDLTKFFTTIMNSDGKDANTNLGQFTATMGSVWENLNLFAKEYTGDGVSKEEYETMLVNALKELSSAITASYQGTDKNDILQAIKDLKDDAKTLYTN
jgi:hypothetical protein